MDTEQHPSSDANAILASPALASFNVNASVQLERLFQQFIG